MNNIKNNNPENIKVLERTQIIIKHKCEVQISEIQDGYHSICHVSCTGKSRSNTWQKTFPSIYGGFSILVAKDLIDLPGNRFLVRQINEHSKGGHCEYEIYLLDIQGNILIQFTGSYNSKFVLDDKHIWFYVSGDKPYSYTFNLDLKMIKLNYKTGKVDTLPSGKVPPHIYGHFWN